MTWVEAQIAGGTSDLASLGTLRYAGPKSVSLLSSWGKFDLPVIDWPDSSSFSPRCFFNLDPGALLFLGTYSWQVIRCLPAQGVCEESDFLFRAADQQLRFLTITQLSDTRLLLLYEGGIVLIDKNASSRWHRLHDDISARIIALTEDEVTIETQWPSELAGKQRTYRLADGKEG